MYENDGDNNSSIGRYNSAWVKRIRDYAVEALYKRLVKLALDMADKTKDKE